MKHDIKEITSQIVFLLACVFLAFYGLYYNSLGNIWLMVATIPFIVYQSFHVGHIRFDINFCFLMETFFVKATLDQQIGKADIVPTTVAQPVLMYLFGKLLVANPEKAKEDGNTNIKAIIALSAMTIGATVLGILNYMLTSKSPIESMGYYSVAFTGNTFYTDKLAYMFNFFFIVSFAVAIIAWLFYKFTNKGESIKKIRPIVLLVVSLFASAAALKYYLSTDRFAALREGVQLIVTKHWGNFGLDLTYNNSTSNMWLDYGRDYGILVFVTLFFFFILTIKDTIKLILNEKVNIFVKTWLIMLFSMTNEYYFTDAFAYIYPYYWYIGLIVCGMISEVSKNDI